MKKTFQKHILNLLLVGSLGLTAFGVSGIKDVHAVAEYSAPSLTTLFTTNNSAKVQKDDGDATKTAFTLVKGSSVEYKRDIALKWFTAKDTPSYLTMAFALKDKNFKTLEFTFRSVQANAGESDNAENKLVFETDEESVNAYVKDANGTESAKTDVTANLSALTLTTTEGDTVGSFAVSLNGTKIGEFTNIGENHFDYVSSTRTPLTVSATFADGAEESVNTVVLFNELNGQSFELNDNGLIKADTASPVLVLNESVKKLILGDALSFDAEFIDVLDSSVTKETYFYQYNPTDTEKKYEKKSLGDVRIMDTSYDYDEMHYTVVKDAGREYVSVKYTLTDDAMTDKGASAVEYFLEWYVDGNNLVSPDPANHHGATTPFDTDLFLSAERQSMNAPHYAASFDKDGYQAKITEKAESLTAGVGNYLYFDCPVGLFDNTDSDYKKLSYSIYSRSQTNSSGSSATSAEYNTMKIPVSTAGAYEIRIVATDKSENATEVYHDGKWVKITSSNVWTLDEVPSFSFTVQNGVSSVKDTTSGRKSTGNNVNKKITVSSFTVNGVSDYDTKYILLYVDTLGYKEKTGNDLTTSLLTNVDYSSLSAHLDTGKDGYEQAVVDKYIALALNQSEATQENVLDKSGQPVFKTVESGSEGWTSGSLSFTPTKTGTYVMLGVFTDALQFSNVVAGYTVVSVIEEGTEIDGDTMTKIKEWIVNNKLAVIFFAIAFVLLIVIIVLLCIKPSDETLDDVKKSEKKQPKQKKEEVSEEPQNKEE